MAQPWQHQQRRRRCLLAALLVLLSLCCLAGLGGAASAPSAASGSHRKDGAAIATEKAAGQIRGVQDQEAARGVVEDELPVRMEMEVDVQDYPGANANARHDPGYPRGPQHP